MRMPREDLHRLMIARRILYWAGRSAAPRKDEMTAREQEAMSALSNRLPGSKGKIKLPRSFSWDDFNRIYQMAAGSFWGIRAADRQLTVDTNPTNDP